MVAYRIFSAPEPTTTPTPSKTLRPTATITSSSSPTLTPTITNTPRPTLTPTITETPTQTLTPSVTPLPTGLPTLTPARPASLSGAYDLNQWSAENADYLAQLMQGYPETLPESSRGKDNQAYFKAYEYAIVAQREALLRYPEEPQVEKWRWDLAYNLALTGDLEAGQWYAELLADYLNRGEVDIEYLYAWFPIIEPRMALYMTEVNPPAGYLVDYIVELRSSGGSAFIRLLEATRGYEAQPILTRFDFINSPQANWIVANLDRKPQEEDDLAIYFSNLPDQFQLYPPYVLDLSKTTPVEMSFLPEKAIFNVGMDFTNYWFVLPDQSGKNTLVFESTIYPPCPVIVRRVYRWNGMYFDFFTDRYLFGNLPSSISSCEAMVEHAVSYWGPAAAIPLMESLLPDWPPAVDFEGNPFPADAKDEWRYRLGVYKALNGDLETAIRYFSEVSTHPTVVNSRWIAPSQDILGTYQKPTDIYQACVRSEFCLPTYAIQYMVDHLPTEADALQYLWHVGVKTNSSGFFDFDGDGEAERWFTVRHRPREKLEFWILAKYHGGVEALKVATTITLKPTLDYLEEAYIDDEGLALQPAVLLDGEVAFSMRRLPDSQKPYLVSVPLREEYPSRFLVPLKSYQKALFNGVSPEIIQQKLLDLQEFPGLLCKATWSCDAYYYFLGLASELAGDQRAAVEAYHRLWSDYSRSPYTIMGRLKLTSLAAIVSPSPTPTSTLVLSPTPTMTATPSQTASITPSTSTPTTTMTKTPTPTASPTITGTRPTSTSTSTPTLTSTPTPTEFVPIPTPYIPPLIPTFTPYP